MKGIIALDIDGTVTAKIHQIDPKVVATLEEFAAKGWQLAFITGRTFRWGYASLKPLKFPYYLAVQNGALCLKMPERTTVIKHYLTDGLIPSLDDYFADKDVDYVIYSGYEDDDRCYYRPARFSGQWLDYLKGRTEALQENWVAVDDFDFLKGKTFASMKTFMTQEEADPASLVLESRYHLHAPVIRDPYDSNVMVVQGIDKKVSKGYVVRELRQIMGKDLPVIAAGDDLNDLPLLQAADIKIAMGSAPTQLQDIADIIAPPATELGLISALYQARERISKEESCNKHAQ
ncbi:MAG: HAD family phosphatase [Chlamydiales bacterium]|nr:HAD family phosphatase [Chlamydiia bacterium]MCP5508199.1 HAD family phosphatase [Chlamydiales bacterium]